MPITPPGGKLYCPSVAIHPDFTGFDTPTRDRLRSRDLPTGELIAEAKLPADEVMCERACRGGVTLTDLPLLTPILYLKAGCL